MHVELVHSTPWLCRRLLGHNGYGVGRNEGRKVKLWWCHSLSGLHILSTGRLLKALISGAALRRHWRPAVFVPGRCAYSSVYHFIPMSPDNFPRWCSLLAYLSLPSRSGSKPQRENIQSGAAAIPRLLYFFFPLPWHCASVAGRSSHRRVMSRDTKRFPLHWGQ